MKKTPLELILAQLPKLSDADLARLYIEMDLVQMSQEVMLVWQKHAIKALYPKFKGGAPMRGAPKEKD